jgi:ornithine carbamoyltransferase
LVLGVRHFLQVLDASKTEILSILKAAAEFKKTGYGEPLLSGKVVALLFEKPSTRTRISLSSAILKLGGDAVYLSAGELQLARGEPIKDTARVLSRYVDVIAARLNHHATLEEIARYSDVPVINALTDAHHPCQALADIATMLEYAGGWGFKVAYVGDCGNVCRSLLQICALLGVNISVASPKGYWFPREEIDRYREMARSNGAHVAFTEDPREAVREADFVYTDVFVSMGLEAERERRLRDFLPRYQVTPELMAHAKPTAKFMHCMPIRRGEEVVDEVVESKQSIIFDQAEYRMHTAAALLCHVLAAKS